MLTSLVEIAGLWFVVACAIDAVAVFVKQAGAVWSPDEEGKRRHGLLALFELIVSMLTPALLLTHAFLVTRGSDQALMVFAAPFAAMILGALPGALFGATIPGTRAIMRSLALPFALGTLAVTIYATWPSIQALIEGAQNNWTISAP